MKTTFLLVLSLCCLCQPASAKAYFQTKREMIERAEVIAIVTVSDVGESYTKGGTWTYRQEGNVKVETVLKGKIPTEFTVHGAETFICAQCPITKDRFIAFLKKDGTLWAGSNWQLSFRPIHGDQVDWYVDDTNRYEMKATPLAKVLEEIKGLVPAGPTS